MNALSPGKDQIVREFPIVNQRGLHARASAKFVQLASGFEASVHVEKDGGLLDGLGTLDGGGLLLLGHWGGLGCRGL